MVFSCSGGLQKAISSRKDRKAKILGPVSDFSLVCEGFRAVCLAFAHTEFFETIEGVDRSAEKVL